MVADQSPAAGAPPVTVDARGMRCPWPLIRLARALRDGAAVVDLLADDPGVAAEVATYAANRDLGVATIDGGFRVTAR